MIVTSHGKSIDFDENYFFKMTDSSAEIDNIVLLRDRLKTVGWLYIKNFFDKEEILDLREYYFSQFSENTILKEGTTPRQGIFSGNNFSIPYGTKGHPAYDFVRSEKLKSFANNEKLHTLSNQLLEKNTIQLPRKVFRNLNRNAKTSAKAHSDAQWANGDVLTSWIVLGDCPIDVGGLVYLEKSHEMDLQTIKALFPEFLDSQWITDDLKALSDKTKMRWGYIDYEAGDLMLHLIDNIHASLDSNNDYMRLSIELRYIADDADLDSRWTRDWEGGDGY